MRRRIPPALCPDKPKQRFEMPKPPPFRADPRVALAWALASVAAAAVAGSAILEIEAGLHQELVEVVAERPEEVWVPVPVADIPFGRRIEASDLELVPFRATLIPEGALTTIERIEGRVAVERILAGDLVREERLAAPRAGDGIHAVLPDGMRAELLNLDASASLRGLLEPDSRVDVLATFEDDEDGSWVTRTLLTDVRVLAVDDRVQRERVRTIKRKPGVLLELLPQEAEVVAAAMHDGSIRLVLVGEAEGVRDRRFVAR